MSFIKRNLWVIGFVVVLGGAFLAMWAAGRGTSLPPTVGGAEPTTTFEITGEDHIQGAANAKVTIVEFSDFQCPACKSYAPFLEGVLEEYPEDVRLVYKHYPLKSIHFRAEAAALASEAASAQGKFWEMAKKLFDGQDTWSKQTGTAEFEKYAQELGLDLTKFKSDMGSDAVKARVNRDVDLGVSLGANSTPTLYINGKLFDNRQSGQVFLDMIDAELGGPSTTPALE